MSKRGAEADGIDARDNKRSKTQPPSTVVTDIWSAHDLQNLLNFTQDGVQDLRNGIQSFKLFLEAILYSKDDPNRPAKINILNDYLDAAKLRASRDKDAEYLPDFMQAWSFANQTNNDHLASAVSSILALLLKTIATLLESREYGILLAKTLMNHAQLKLISRSVAAPKHKEHVISPCLRILTEIVSFDGGLLAKQLYSKRDFTFETKIVARNLGLVKGGQGPSVRSNAIRYLLSNFKYQGEGAKIDILKNGHITKALFDNLKEDSAEVLQEVFKIIEANVLRDETIPRSIKSHTVSERSLAGVLAALRAYSNIEAEDDSPAARGKLAALSFLKLVCTTQSLGVLRASGWYPPGSERHTKEQTDDFETDLALDLGLDSVEWYNRFQTQVPVRNTILSGFSQTLRPYASEEERDILLAILTAAPEIVADYFFSMANKFSFEPKLTNTWIGYASFLFSSVQIPFPKYFGASDSYTGCPPPVSIAIENILPSPLTQKIMTRSLNQSSDLITHFAVRILIVAFQKLQQVLKAFAVAAAEGNPLWTEASRRLESVFCERCPPIKDVIATFRKTPDEKILQREAISRLLRVYYEVTPLIAFEEKFDVSQTLTMALSRVETMSSDEQHFGFRLLELQHLLVIARYSTGMRWWHKQGSLKYSPFTTLLRLSAQTTTDQSTGAEFIKLLQSVMNEHSVLQQQTKESPVNALVASLSADNTWKPSDALFVWLDECLGRLVRKPIKYLDDLDQLTKDANQERGALSVLVSVCMEQIPFTSNLSADDRSNVLTWFSRFIELLKLTGEDAGMLELVKQKVPDLTQVSSKELKATLQAVTARRQVLEDKVPEKTGSSEAKNLKQTIAFSDPPVEKPNHPELAKWQQKDLDQALENGDINELILCLSSQDGSVRLQALAAMRKLMAKVKESTHEEKDQIYLLIGELSETVMTLPTPISQQALPHIASVFATQALDVLQDPSHFMYPKINKYLNKGPSWNVQKLANYWVDRTILEIPDEDDKHWAEIEFVLELFVLGTRTQQDVHLLIPRNCMEKILGLFSSPSAPKAVKDAVMKLAYRVAAVGGATSLVTRTGMLAWLSIRASLGDVEPASLKVLKKKVNEGIDDARVKNWSKGALAGDGVTTET